MVPTRDAKMFCAAALVKPHRLPRIMREKNDEQHRQIGKVAMDVLQNQREIFFAEIFFARLADGARDRVGPKPFVISAAIIIAGETKSARPPQNKKRRRKHQPGRPPSRFAKPRVRGRSKNFRRIKRREIIRAIAREPIIISLKRRPSRVNDERGKSEKTPAAAESTTRPGGKFVRNAVVAAGHLRRP